MPGSGKSTLASKLVPDSAHVESDDYFITDGKYKFDIEKLSDAHIWCKKSVEDLMKIGVPCAVSNTSIQRWEYQPYLDMATRYKYDVQVIDCHSEWVNIHSVPDDVLKRMKERWEPHYNDSNVRECNERLE